MSVSSSCFLLKQIGVKLMRNGNWSIQHGRATNLFEKVWYGAMKNQCQWKESTQTPVLFSRQERLLKSFPLSLSLSYSLKKPQLPLLPPFLTVCLSTQHFWAEVKNLFLFSLSFWALLVPGKGDDSLYGMGKLWLTGFAPRSAPLRLISCGQPTWPKTSPVVGCEDRVTFR